MIALQAPPVKPHRDCKNGPHASLRESTVSNWSASRVFDVQLHLPGATGDEIATITKSTLAPGETWRVDWGVSRGSGKVPLLHPDEHGHYDVVMNLLWADAPGGPLWQRGADGKARRAPGHTAWRRMLRSVRGAAPGRLVAAAPVPVGTIAAPTLEVGSGERGCRPATGERPTEPGETSTALAADLMVVRAATARRAT
ncbi:hypothetical protein [Streptomyces sp. SM13]|uniref:hypothetical protein n=1 Tax=Streptomyces sp. SM13 TaxID=1983803 RepID=UPI000CD54087|nr:hypothetical protein [Streptomyces sp. SM13]